MKEIFALKSLNSSPTGVTVGSLYLVMIVLFEATGGFGVYRSLLLFIFFYFIMMPAFVNSWKRSKVITENTFHPLLLLLISFIPIFDAALTVNTVHLVRAMDDLIVWGVIMAFCVIGSCQGPQERHQRQPFMLTLAFAVLFSPILIPLAHLVSGFVVPKLYDIATTTADAARAMLAGANPYDLPIDTLGAASVKNPEFSGYKYLPAMPILYFLFVLIGGNQGILVANMIFYIAIVIVVFYINRTILRQGEYLAVLLFLSTPIVSSEALAMGATDLAPVLLLLVAFSVWSRSPFTTGLLLGFSISMKLAPGLFAVILLLPSQGRTWWRYVCGVALGVLPAIFYFYWSPNSFIKNIFLFNFIRPIDSFTWRFYAPEWAGYVASAASLLLWIGLSVWCVVCRANLLTRIFSFIVIIIGILLSGPTIRDNYAIWWSPFVAIVLATLDYPARALAGEYGKRYPR